MNQAEYRAFNHFREAIEKASGEQIFVDDLTFDPAAHEEIAVIPEPAAHPIVPSDPIVSPGPHAEA